MRERIWIDLWEETQWAPCKNSPKSPHGGGDSPNKVDTITYSLGIRQLPSTAAQCCSTTGSRSKWSWRVEGKLCMGSKTWACTQLTEEPHCLQGRGTLSVTMVPYPGGAVSLLVAGSWHWILPITEKGAIHAQRNHSLFWIWIPFVFLPTILLPTWLTRS